MSTRDTDTRHERVSAESLTGRALCSLPWRLSRGLRSSCSPRNASLGTGHLTREEMGFCACGRGGGRPARSCGGGGAGHGDPSSSREPVGRRRGCRSSSVSGGGWERFYSSTSVLRSHLVRHPYDWPYTGILSSALSPRLSPKLSVSTDKRGAWVSGCLWLWACSPSVPCGVGHPGCTHAEPPARQPCRGSPPPPAPRPIPLGPGRGRKGSALGLVRAAGTWRALLPILLTPAFPVPAGGGCSLPCLPREGRAARCTPRGQSKCTSLVTCSDRLHGLSFTPRAQEHVGTSFENNLPPLRPAPTSAALQHPPQSKAGCALPHRRRSVHFTSSTEYCGSSTASPTSTECHGSSTTSPGHGPGLGAGKISCLKGKTTPVYS